MTAGSRILRRTRRGNLPFYAGAPVAIVGKGWALLLLAMALGLAALVTIPATTFPATLVPALLFMGMPLVALRIVAGPHWTALFRHVRLRQVGQMVLFAILTMLASGFVGFTLQQLGQLTPNPVIEEMMEMTAGNFLLRLIPTVPQLIGEELLTVLPLLAILWFATVRLGLGPTPGIVLAVAGSSFVFAAVHLPTYDWQFAQCFGVIGTARLMLTIAFLWTRNLWVSAGAHILNDWSELTLSFAFSHEPIETVQAL